VMSQAAFPFPSPCTFPTIYAKLRAEQMMIDPRAGVGKSPAPTIDQHILADQRFTYFGRPTNTSLFKIQ
jgi:hypothetical protein